ncbi:MAG: hypothetical protein KY457_07445 [Actinobacteria bacterium]|nr:hypothetical protein [Actinomycetota bacterium]
MSRALAAAEGLATAWTAFYTRDLPAEVRERRRREIASDVWEHEHAALAAGEHAVAVAVDILLRVVRGMAADVLWGWSTLRGRGAGSPLTGRVVIMVNRLVIAAGVAVTAFLGVYFLANGFSIGFGAGGDQGELYPLYGIIEMVAGLLLLAGVGIGPRRPRLAVAAIAVGAVAISVTHVWLLVLNIPATIAVIGAAVWRMRSASRQEGPPATAAATS